MKKIFLTFIFIISIFFNTTVNSTYYFYSNYYWESIEAFISSPNKNDLSNISNQLLEFCETIYLEATRRREYTDLETAICSEIFEIKRQQELDYINYMYKNRWIY